MSYVSEKRIDQKREVARTSKRQESDFLTKQEQQVSGNMYSQHNREYHNFLFQIQKEGRGDAGKDIGPDKLS